MKGQARVGTTGGQEKRTPGALSGGINPLSGPEALASDLPGGIRPCRLVWSCIRPRCTFPDARRS